MSRFPPTFPSDPSPYRDLRPHRATLILIFGILGIVTCFAFGIAAFIMGGSDLKEMDAGRMDPSGREMTNAGRILGIISICLPLLLLFVWLGIVILAIIGSAASGGRGP